MKNLPGSFGRLLLLAYVALILLVFAVSFDVVAQPNAVTLEWTPPTERESGDPLAADELASYVLGCRIGGEIEDVLSIEASQTQTTVPRHELFPTFGEYTCALAAIDTGGLRSAWSNEVVIEWEVSPPAAPVLRIVTE